MATRKSARKSAGKSGRKSTRKVGKKMSKWTAFVKKMYAELKKKNKNASLGDAMKLASKRKSEM